MSDLYIQVIWTFKIVFYEENDKLGFYAKDLLQFGVNSTSYIYGCCNIVAIQYYDYKYLDDNNFEYCSKVTNKQIDVVNQYEININHNLFDTTVVHIFCSRFITKATKLNSEIQQKYIKNILPSMMNDLERRQKALDAYLEAKRNKFSNPALLLILSQGSDEITRVEFDQKSNIISVIDKEILKLNKLISTKTLMDQLHVNTIINEHHKEAIKHAQMKQNDVLVLLASMTTEKWKF